MSTISRNYRKSKRTYAGGGSLFKDADGQKDAGNFQAATAAGGMILDGVSKPNEYGRTSTGSQIGKGALAGASMGSVAGPWGAAIGAVVGGAYGWIKGGISKGKEEKFIKDKNSTKLRVDQDASNARLASNPELVSGDSKAQYFGVGGKLPLTDGFGTGDEEEPKRKKDNSPMTSDLYSGIVTNEKISPDGPTQDDFLKNTVEYLKNNYPGYSNIYRSQFEHHDSNVNKSKFPTLNSMNNPVDAPLKKDSKLVDYAANGGRISRKYRTGGTLVQKSSDGVEVQGPSHAQGGVKVPGTRAEVEGGETIKDDYVFSKDLGFADMHKPLMTAKGKIEKKPATPDRINAIKMITRQENMLKASQEAFKKQNNIK